jgi:ABC-2 type transport system permease protein
MTDLALTLRQFRYTNKTFWRNPFSAGFTFAFPLMFLVLFTAIFGGGTTCLLTLANGNCAPGRTVATSTFYVPAIIAFSVITACYTNIALSVTAARDNGVLKRVRGSPLPGWSYLLARILHAVFVALVLVAICMAFGRIFYDARLPLHTVAPFVVTLVVGAASFCALGLAITAFIPNVEAAPALVNFSILPILFISDIFIPIPSTATTLNTIGGIFAPKHFETALLTSYFPKPGQSPWLWHDLLIVGIWGVAGLVIALRRFSWEPRR